MYLRAFRILKCEVVPTRARGGEFEVFILSFGAFAHLGTKALLISFSNHVKSFVESFPD
jgi:hypothetical protein